MLVVGFLVDVVVVVVMDVIFDLFEFIVVFDVVYFFNVGVLGNVVEGM